MSLLKAIAIRKSIPVSRDVSTMNSVHRYGQKLFVTHRLVLVHADVAIRKSNERHAMVMCVLM
jgi:hypothetical protein